MNERSYSTNKKADSDVGFFVYSKIKTAFSCQMRLRYWRVLMCDIQRPVALWTWFSSLNITLYYLTFGPYLTPCISTKIQLRKTTIPVGPSFTIIIPRIPSSLHDGLSKVYLKLKERISSPLSSWLSFHFFILFHFSLECCKIDIGHIDWYLPNPMNMRNQSVILLLIRRLDCWTSKLSDITDNHMLVHMPLKGRSHIIVSDQYRPGSPHFI